MDVSLKYLLKKLMFGKISPKDFSGLKKTAHSTSDAALDNELKGIWEETSEHIPMSPESKTRILSEIHLQMDSDANTGRKSFYRLKIAAAVILPLLFSIGSYFYFSTKYQESLPELFTIVAGPGHKAQLYLPDGTHVWLNSDSRLTYYSNFNKNNRNIKLEGEAFFDVSKQDNQMFTVETEHVNVIVHGTAFNVSSYAEEPSVRVALLRGEITLEDRENPKHAMRMMPEQLALISKEDGQWFVTGCDPEIESLWTRNMLKFENATTKEVFRKLERWYGMNIHIANPDTALLYTFTLKSESLTEMLILINRITPITYKVNGEEVIIKYKR